MSYTIVEIEVTHPLPPLSVPEDATGIAIILRRQGRPIAFLLKALPEKTAVTSEELDRLIAQDIRPYLLPEENLLEDPLTIIHLEHLRSLTVAICTKDRPEDLAQCLDQLLTLKSSELGGSFEVLVVDNAPSSDQTRKLVTSLPGIRYVREPKPGLNFARNRAVQEATGKIIAFIDDDVVVDRYWLKGLLQAVSKYPDAAAFTGLVLPLELLTEAQILFEARGGFEKSFETIRYGQDLPNHPFYPCIGGKFGTGCNMAFLRNVLIELGGFDEALDTGSALPGGGDTDMFYRVVRAGYPLIYEPQFMVFHRHRREYQQLRRQYCRSWGQGLMAFVAKSYNNDISQRSKLRRLVFWWFGYHLHELLSSVKGNHVLPPDMLLAEIWGGIIGLLGAYPRSLRRIEKIRRQYS